MNIVYTSKYLQFIAGEDSVPRPSGTEPVKESEKQSAVYCSQTLATHFNVYINNG